MKSVPATTCLLLVVLSSLSTADEVVFVRDGAESTLACEILVIAQNDEMLVRATDGRLWVFTPEEIVSFSDTDEVPDPMRASDIGDMLLEELPEGFRIYKTDSFVVAYQTERTYARWVGGLYEKVFRNFEKFWDENDLELTDPDFPLVAIVFATREQYLQYVQQDLNAAAGTMVAYYNQINNRVVMYDLTSDLVGAGQQLSARRVADILSTDAAVPLVSTIVHEGIHQQIFNRGMQQRLADAPLWLHEGLALFFEPPDPGSGRGWNQMGHINMLRYPGFMRTISTRAPGALEQLVATDELFLNGETAVEAYSHAWALNYFLINEHPEKMVSYIKYMARKEPFDFDAETLAETRLREFKQHFGEDLGMLDREFIAFMRALN
ncbi:MAG: DUF1570 domain-containing protein [Planctomycetota bacterium]